MEPSETKPTKMEPTETKPIRPKVEIDQVISNQTDVAMTLTKYILQKNNTSNVVFSPISLQLVLGLVAAGSEGETLDQLLSFLKAESTDELNSLASHLVKHVFTGGSHSGEPTLSLANGVWIDKSLSFKPFFSKVVDDVYKAVSDVDFQNKASEATDKVNSWVEKETNGLIKDTVPPDLFDYLTRIVFVNAIYFKGSWVDQFCVWQTQNRDFHLLNGKSVQIPFMTSDMGYRYISAFDEFKVLKLPYKQEKDTRHISMYIFLPDAKEGLPTLVDKLALDSGFIDGHIPNDHRRVPVDKFWIPKFKVSFDFEATEAFKEFGVKAPFIPGALDSLVYSEVIQWLHVTNIFQKSSIEVNESGTEASASSCVVLCGGGCPPVKVDFVADHPFLFVIREDRTRVVLFVGQVLDPLAS
ncbi:SERPIN domain-containing protein [Heracleum sosnowskyi]|uniref:SERPIN domain-containing protein n=1 Tax=Heracleum sosnowskyi TaxID=360622 RepID=A0AAD8J286_9APIA|nr:SERPIN domain-containing protein [Heracleum sosnowskyi]